MKLLKIFPVLFIVLIFVPSVNAGTGIYPSSTPYIITRENTRYTIEVTPKYWMVKPEPLTWHIKLRVDVLEDNRVQRILFCVKVVTSENTLNECDLVDSTVYIYDKDDNPVGVMEYWMEHSNEGPGGPFYTGVVETDSFFSKGDFFYLECDVSYDVTVSYGMNIFETWWSATGDMQYEGNNGDWTEIKCEIGDSYVLENPPQFVIPELPLGTITAIATMASAVLLKRRK